MGELKVKDAKLEAGPGSEASVQLSGIDRTDWKYKLSNGSFKDEIIDLTVPSDAADAARAMYLVN